MRYGSFDPKKGRFRPQKGRKGDSGLPTFLSPLSSPLIRSLRPGPLVPTMSSSPNGPPVAYAYITNTNGSSPAFRTAARVALILFVWVEMFVGLVCV